MLITKAKTKYIFIPPTKRQRASVQEVSNHLVGNKVSTTTGDVWAIKSIETGKYKGRIYHYIAEV